MAERVWSIVAADNDDADIAGGIGLRGVADSIRSGDDSMRAMMQKRAIALADNSGSRATTGSSNSYAYASAGAGATPADGFTAYADGDTLLIEANHTNTGAATLNVDSVGAKAIRMQGDIALVGGELRATGKYKFVYDSGFNSAAGAWVVVNPSPINNNTLATANANVTASAEAIKAYVDSRTVLGTAQSTTSGSSKEWASLPAGIRELTVKFDTVRTTDTATPLIQLGDSTTGGYITSGYSGRSTGQAQANGQALSSGVLIYSNIWTAAANAVGRCVFKKFDDASNVWTFHATINDAGAVQSVVTTDGRVALGGTLDRVKVFTTAAFQASSIGDQLNIEYKF